MIHTRDYNLKGKLNILIKVVFKILPNYICRPKRSLGETLAINNTIIVKSSIKDLLWKKKQQTN